MLFLQTKKKGGVANTVVVNVVAKAVIAKSNDARSEAFDIDSSFWAKRLFKRTGFVKHASTTGRVEIRHGARKRHSLFIMKL